MIIIRSTPTYTTNILIRKKEEKDLFEKVVSSNKDNGVEGRIFIERWIDKNKKHILLKKIDTDIYEYSIIQEKDFIILTITWYIGKMREKKLKRKIKTIHCERRSERKEYKDILVSGILFYQKEDTYTEQDLEEIEIPILEKIYDEEFLKKGLTNILFQK